MIQATYRKKGIRITQVWYPDGENHKFTGTDLVFYHAVDKEDNGKNRMATMFHTLMSDLLLPEEELPMNASGLETPDNIWDLFETSLRVDSPYARTRLFEMAKWLEESQNLLDWIEKTPAEKQAWMEQVS